MIDLTFFDHVVENGGLELKQNKYCMKIGITKICRVNTCTQKTFGIGIGPQQGNDTPAVIVASIVAKNELPPREVDVRKMTTANKPTQALFNPKKYKCRRGNSHIRELKLHSVLHKSGIFCQFCQ